MKKPIVQSHRGAGALAPENTLESFAASWQMGTVPEADLRTTKDGVIVAFHDANFARVVKDVSPELRDKGVQDVTFELLSSLDVGAAQGEAFTGQRVCRIEEVFAAMQGHPERSLYLDIKNVNLPQLAALARQFEVTQQVILAAPKEALLREWVSLVYHGQSQTLLWMGITRVGDESTLRTRLDGLKSEGFGGITQLQIHVEAKLKPDGDGWEFKPTRQFLCEAAGQLQEHGVLFQVLPWDCADIGVYRALLRAGVQSFASDYPEVALRALLERE